MASRTFDYILQDGQTILDRRFVVHKRIGSGAFGEIYKGKFNPTLR